MSVWVPWYSLGTIIYVPFIIHIYILCVHLNLKKGLELKYQYSAAFEHHFIAAAFLHKDLSAPLIIGVVLESHFGEQSVSFLRSTRAVSIRDGANLLSLNAM